MGARTTKGWSWRSARSSDGDTDVDLGRLTALGGSGGTQTELPPGCLARVVGALETGACVIEVWQTGEDAKRFSEESAPRVSVRAAAAASRGRA